MTSGLRAGSAVQSAVHLPPSRPPPQKQRQEPGETEGATAHRRGPRRARLRANRSGHPHRKMHSARRGSKRIWAATTQTHTCGALSFPFPLGAERLRRCNNRHKIRFGRGERYRLICDVLCSQQERPDRCDRASVIGVEAASSSGAIIRNATAPQAACNRGLDLPPYGIGHV